MSEGGHLFRFLCRLSHVVLVTVFCFSVTMGSICHARTIVNVGAREAIVVYLQGDVKISHGEGDAKHPLSLRDKLKDGDHVFTGNKSQLGIMLADETRLRFAEHTTFKVMSIQCNVKELKQRAANFFMTMGKSWANVKKMPGMEPKFRFTSVTSVAAVRGTIYRMNVHEDQSTLVRVYDGEVAVSNSEEAAMSGEDTSKRISRPKEIEGPHKVSMEEWVYIIKSMQEISVGRDGTPGTPKSFDAEQDRDEWVEWNKSRDAQPEADEASLEGEPRREAPPQADSAQQPAEAAREKPAVMPEQAGKPQPPIIPSEPPEKPTVPEEGGFLKRFKELFRSTPAGPTPAPESSEGTKQARAIKPPLIDFSRRDVLTYKLTLAVLPLENISNRNDLNWLSEAIPESIIIRLQNVRSLHMVERMRIKRVLEEQKLSGSALISAESAQRAGKMLGADTIMIGSFSEFQGTVQIRVRLVNVETGVILRAEEATGLLNRIFQLQDRLAEKLTLSLGIALADDEHQRLSMVETNSLQAYERYVQGRDHYFQFNRTGYEKAVELYRDAIRLDPNFALAYAGIGDSLATLAYSRRRAGESYEDLLKEAREASLKAIALAPNLSDGYRALAYVYNNDFDFRTARRHVEKALQLNPNDAEAWHIMAQTATASDYPDLYNLERAQIYYENAIKLNPDFAMAYNNLGWYVYLEKRWYDKAIEAFERAIQISPDFTEAYDSLGETWLRLEKFDQAEKCFRKALELQPDHRHAKEGLDKALKKMKR